MSKPRIAFIGLTSCKGCFFQFFLLGRRLNAVFRNIEISDFWMLKEFNEAGGPFDLTFMDGAVSNNRELLELEKARKKTKFLVAFGTCACSGGIPALRNGMNIQAPVRADPMLKPRDEVTPLDAHVKVDYHMHGCPISEDEAFEVISDVLAGKTPKEKNYCVCVECKKREIKCLFKEGVPCFGPVTFAGCNAPCPAARTPCDGCRGRLPDGNAGAEARLLEEHGVTRQEIESVFRRYSNRTGAASPSKPAGGKR